MTYSLHSGPLKRRAFFHLGTLFRVMEWFSNDDFWREFYGYMFSAERFSAAPQEVDGVLRLAQCSSGAVLDLCCGPGRHAVEFARRGFAVTGVDGSSFLLGRAKEYAQQEGTTVEW